jgi:ParB-like chromosome segregation protein Spo0J
VEGVMQIDWIALESLKPPPWGTSFMTARERRALTASLRDYGWLTPLLVTRGDVIIDGFHRYECAQNSKALLTAVGALAPARVLDVDDDEALMIHARVNGIRGTQIAVAMANLVERHQTKSDDELAGLLGLHPSSIQTLRRRDLFSYAGVQDHKFNRAWYPQTGE